MDNPQPSLSTRGRFTDCKGEGLSRLKRQSGPWETKAVQRKLREEMPVMES